MGIDAGYVFKDGEELLAKKINLAFSGVSSASFSGDVHLGSTSKLAWNNGSGNFNVLYFTPRDATSLTFDTELVASGNGFFGAGLPTAGQRAFATDVSGDAFNRWQLFPTGQMNWGSGAAAPDTFLYRNGVALLQLDSAFSVSGPVTATGVVTAGVVSGFKLGSNLFALFASNRTQIYSGPSGTAIFDNSGATIYGLFDSNGLAVTGDIMTSSTTLHKTSVALTNGAAASIGTLTNAPAAGNPTKWVPLNDNGTTRYIPCW